ncbi:hypothetical protein JCM18899A_19040 [Nocardioides sp. AN3]
MNRRLTVREVAEILSTSEQFVYDEIWRKNLRASKTGRWTIDEADLDRYIEAKVNAPAFKPVRRPWPWS